MILLEGVCATMLMDNRLAYRSMIMPQMFLLSRQEIIDFTVPFLLAFTFTYQTTTPIRASLWLIIMEPRYY